MRRELGDGDHLVGDAFTVADLSVASHFYWFVQPPEGPRLISRLPHELAELMAPFEGSRGHRWVLETYRRHRHRCAPPVTEG